MHMIHVRNVNGALSQGLWWLKISGNQELSRNGLVIVSPEPVSTVYTHPVERVLFNQERNANPFFHLMEALWMLAGRRDLKWPLFFNSRFKDYSDDGKTINGAYGFRWREHFVFDQLSSLIEHLHKHSHTRRAVLQMWDCTEDLDSRSKDIPCNTHIYFDRRNDVLNMLVCCRSNDIIWGAYGANAVHFSILQEFISGCLKIPVGVYTQMSFNYHMYPSNYDIDNLELRIVEDHYMNFSVEPYKLIRTNIEAWMEDLDRFVSDPLGDTAYNDLFFDVVAAPMYAAWSDRKNGGTGVEAARAIVAQDWRRACLEWIARAEQRKRVLSNDTNVD